MTEPQRPVVDATVVSVAPDAEPINAMVVGDRRRQFGRRVGIAAMGMLVLFFSINGYIQSAKNGEQATRNGKLLVRAAQDRSRLIDSINRDTALIEQLQRALRIQNEELRKAGIKTVRIPTETNTNGSKPGTGQPVPNPSPKSSPRPGSQPVPNPRPGPTPSPSKQPSGPIEKTKDKVCNLTGLCLPFSFHLFHIFVE